MNELLAQQLHLSKLKAVSASPEEQKSKLVDEASSLLDLVSLKEKQLSSLLGAESYTCLLITFQPKNPSTQPFPCSDSIH